MLQFMEERGRQRPYSSGKEHSPRARESHTGTGGPHREREDLCVWGRGITPSAPAATVIGVDEQDFSGYDAATNRGRPCGNGRRALSLVSSEKIGEIRCPWLSKDQLNNIWETANEVRKKRSRSRKMGRKGKQSQSVGGASSLALGVVIEAEGAIEDASWGPQG
ncbi:hypothetical protein GWK47_004024 [Chionoecetes opilio]|uniref:Uncharacterized protein n=1 Tax=Chionoecetes opilio TaxID=41210 RepID=A0A8J4YUI2_CHIOP|nr:hypothetical protein GWK47_004024 [Chionoecetes opilio]